MSSSVISQREARRMRKELNDYRRREAAQANCFASDWPGGALIATRAGDGALVAAIGTARLLKHGVVVTLDGGTVRYHAVRLQGRS